MISWANSSPRESTTTCGRTSGASALVGMSTMALNHFSAPTALR